MNNFGQGDPSSSIYNNKFKMKKSLLIVGFVIFAVATVFVAYKLNFIDTFNNKSKAAAGTAKITFSPTSSTVSSEGMIRVWINTSEKTAFVRVVVTFDRTKLKLSRRPEVSNAYMQKTIYRSSTEAANKSGRIIMAFALPPVYKSHAPIGNFEFAKLYFMPLTSTTNTTKLNVLLSDTQIVGINEKVMTSSYISSSVTAKAPSSISNTYLSFTKFSANKYVSPNVIKAGDTVTFRNFDPNKAKLLSLRLYDYKNMKYFDTVQSSIKSTSRFVKSVLTLPYGVKYAYRAKFQDIKTGVVKDVFFNFNTIK